MSARFKDLVPVEGVFRLFTDTGVFLSVQNRVVSWIISTCPRSCLASCEVMP
jgi:hypothetical protein